MKLLAKHIAEEWDEGRPEDGGDGYWIVLRPGWKWAGDPVGCCHSIHEDTRRLARAEGVLPCKCRDCASHLRDGSANLTTPASVAGAETGAAGAETR